MADIKHSFTGAKMNKDLDQRLVQNGEYRNAMNAQVMTTSGGSDGVGEAGTLQNLQGNTEVATATGATPLATGFNDTDFKCVGSIADEKTDSALFLFTSGDFSEEDENSTNSITKIDTIVRENVSTGVTTPIFVDRWGFQCPIASLNQVVEPTGQISGLNFTTENTVVNTAMLRVNMTIEFYEFGNPDNSATAKIKTVLNNNSVFFYDFFDTSTVTWANLTHVRFTNERVLKLDPNINITGINIIDDLLFFTDGVNEPKKINITRSERGTDASGNLHTQLYVTNELGELQLAGDLENETNSPITSATNISTIYPSDVLEEHVTVLRPAPKTAPTIEAVTRDPGELSFTITNTAFNDLTNQGVVVIGLDSEGEPSTTPPLSQTNFQQGDTLIVSEENSLDSEITFFKLTFQGYLTTDTDPPEASTTGPTDQALFQVISNNDTLEEIEPANLEWSFNIDLPKPKFELKFARFAYRYKYEDGEYSAFSPFSELAFDPGVFDYDSLKGYNLGMVNTIQSLKIKDFIPYFTDRALDVVEVEILYKSTDNANVYTIKSIRKEKDPEWELFTPNSTTGINSTGTGELEIKSEVIHRVIQGNQLLRSFDNVPRLAKAQEITGSRILYGNFVQGFDITKPVSLSQGIVSSTVNVQPKKSVKTLRDYKVGMVFGDKYGRETTVIESSSTSTAAGGIFTAASDDFNVPKDLCAFANQIQVQQNWSNPLSNADPLIDMDWMSYVKYYIKETSSEYYNLVLDRWYYARNNDNIWLSFPSADRNKVDIETYLILKKDHGEDKAVLEAARYKIIDIDNEAPEFVRTDRRRMGMMKLGTGTHAGEDGCNLGLFFDVSQSPNTNEPSRLVDADATEIIVPSQFASSLQFLDNYGLTQRGQLMIRVVGRTMVLGGTNDVPVNELNSGDFVKVNHFYKKQNGDLVINIEKSFGQTANMRQAFLDAGLSINLSNSASSSNDLQYFLEFREDVVENKPEFDGRFFVLIEKDASVEKNIEKYTAANQNFVTLRTFRIGYVDTQPLNPALNGPYSESEQTGSMYDDQSIGEEDNTLTDPTAPHQWWGFGIFPFNTSLTQMCPLVNLFAMGCQEGFAFEVDGRTFPYSGEDNGVFGTGLLTRFYWILHKNFHKSVEGFEFSDDFGFAVGSRVFLDGARAHMMDLVEFTPEGLGSEAISDGDDAMKDRGVAAVEPYSTRARNDDIYGGTGQDGVSFFNYKPTALDQGNATEGFGRMMLSKQQKCDKENFGEGEAGELYSFITTDGSYFRFTYDTSNGGEPHIYQIIHKEVVDGVEVFRAPEKAGRGHGARVRNYGPQLGSDTDNEISTNTEYCGDPDEEGENIVSGDFGGENVVWNNQQWRNDLNSMYGAGSATTNSLGFSEFVVGTKDNGSICNEIDNGDGKHKKQRTCGKCTSDDEHCCRQSVRFEFRRINPETGELSTIGLIPEEFDPRGTAKHDGTNGSISIEFLKKSNDPAEIEIPESDRAVWETEPKENVELDIYYEASHAIPMRLEQGNALAFAPLNSKVGVINSNESVLEVPSNIIVGGFKYVSDGVVVHLQQVDNDGNLTTYINPDINVGDSLTFTHPSGLVTRARIEAHYTFSQPVLPLQVAVAGTGYYKLENEVYDQPVKLGWHNCYSFGNGVESDRIRDDFNAPTIDNGVKVSTTVDEYGQENKTSSLIFSGLYNSTSGVNDLNEFNMGEKIIKDLNPEYGSVQALKTRDTNVVVFCEDRILKVLSSKEAVFLADGNPQLTATDRVLGQVSTFVGDYGISQNPESIAQDTYRLYFTDTQRGAVLRLSMDGLTPISNVGMKTWFRENLRNKTKLLGTFDDVNGEYNLTMEPAPVVEGIVSPTISFNEASKGWVSFKSFSPDEGTSVSGRYLTTKNSGVYQHYNEDENARNLFYGAEQLTVDSESSVTVMFNDMPGSVKSFKAMSYEGSQAKVRQNLSDENYYNLFPEKAGWWVESVFTDMEEGRVKEFIDKENKWFNKIKGIETTLDNLDVAEFTVQGIGSPTLVEDPDASDDDTPQTFTLTIQNDESNDPAAQGSGGSSGSGY